jgi:uncharacterized protein YoxC
MSNCEKNEETELSRLLRESVTDHETKSLLDVEREKGELLRQRLRKKNAIARLEREIQDLEASIRALNERENAIVERVTSRVQHKMTRTKDQSAL